MNEPIAADPTWYRALTLAERAALPHPLGKLPGEPNPNLAAQRQARWRSQSPFQDAALFSRRLAADGLDEEIFHRLLGEPPETLAARAGAPPWLRDLEEAFRLPSPADVLPEAARREADFLDAMAPLLTWACDRLRRGGAALAAEHAGVAGAAGAPFDPARVVEIFFPLLVFPVNLIVGRTLTVELHIARQEGRLVGETPEERFRGFVSDLGEPAACLDLLRRYPVLAQQVVVCLRQWSDFALEALGHLAADQEALGALFCRAADGDRLAEVGGGAGDRHRDGRCVLVMRFDSGFRLVYKPKPLAVDVHFQELLAWLNERGLEPPLRTLRVLDRGAYGWEEFAAPEGCANTEEVARFYTRTGSLLALLYALEATDVHLDNLIAAGEHPVLVDLESLFHARFEAMAPRKASDVAERTMGHSVLRAGLLPQRSGGDFETEGFDLSALGGIGGQWSAAPLPDWEGAGTDQIRLVRRRLRIPDSENRPRLKGAEIDTGAILGHGEAILAGFTSVWRLLAGHHGELLAPGGLIDRFAGDEVRAILRPTMSYVRLLQESCHPHVFQSALERDRLFDRLWESAASRSSSGALPDAVITAEHEDLWRGDVPVFTTRPGARDLWDSRGRRILGFCDEASLESVRRRLRGMDERDLARQSWFIRASLTTLELNTDVVHLPTYEVLPPRGRAGRESLLAAARSIGDRLEALAVREEGEDSDAGTDRDVSWIGLTILGEHWALVPLGPDLYAGLPGIALFLSWLGELTGEERFTKLAADALGTARRQLADGAAVLPLVGAFTGWGGMIYTLVHLAALWEDPHLLDAAEEMAAGPLAELIERDAKEGTNDRWDLMAGSAGAVASLLTLHAVRPADRTLGLAIRYGERLLANAVPQAAGIAWQISDTERPLAGFSHGAAGIAWALARLATATGDARFRQAAEEALRYERSLFSPTADNWRDVRNIVRAPDAPQDGDYFMNAWCHGAPGIGLGRLLTRPHMKDDTFDSEIETALATTLREGFGQGHCLCHGDLGNLETLLLAGRAGDGRWANEVERLSAVIVESFERVGWQCGVPEGVETPGLMIGLAGIGYGLLRLAEPGRVPSVLALEGPVAAPHRIDSD
jgi:type 2 lantibiotic biosynthesis protein LanM